MAPGILTFLGKAVALQVEVPGFRTHFRYLKNSWWLGRIVLDRTKKPYLTNTLHLSFGIQNKSWERWMVTDEIPDFKQVSHEKKKRGAILSIESWLV